MKQLLVLLFLVSSMACFGQNKDALKDKIGRAHV